MTHFANRAPWLRTDVDDPSKQKGRSRSLREGARWAKSEMPNLIPEGFAAPCAQPAEPGRMPRPPPRQKTSPRRVLHSIRGSTA
jgi:hypothetical protein